MTTFLGKLFGLRRKSPIVPDIPSRPNAEYHLVPRREEDLLGYGAGFVFERVADGQYLNLAQSAAERGPRVGPGR